MVSHCFDELIRSLNVSRRPLLGGGLAVAAGWLSRAHIAARTRKKRGKRSKLKRNAFGCVNVGGKCRGKDAACCSGICDGKKPKKGRKDTSRCGAHNVDDCPAGADSCLAGNIECTNGQCYQTTGQASFCGVFGECVVCQKDVDCEPDWGPGAACIVCARDCQSAGGTVCAPPGPSKSAPLTTPTPRPDLP